MVVWFFYVWLCLALFGSVWLMSLCGRSCHFCLFNYSFLSLVNTTSLRFELHTHAQGWPATQGLRLQPQSLVDRVVVVGDWGVPLASLTRPPFKQRASHTTHQASRCHRRRGTAVVTGIAGLAIRPKPEG